MKFKTIAITGSTGFIAGALIESLNEYEIIRLKRDDFLLDSKQLAEKIQDADIIINLAGYPIIKRWTNSNKRKIYESRVKSTSKLVDAISLLNKEIHLINASAIGIYSEEGIHNEESIDYSDGFIYEVIRDWEREAMKLPQSIANLTIIRIGIVLAHRAGLLKKINPVFKIGFGGKIGNGKQWMSFIHIEDLIQSIQFIIREKLVGIVNLVAPYYVTNEEFTRAYSHLLRRPAIMPVPVLLLKLFYGEGARIIYSGHRIVPDKLMKHGYTFKYPDINSALKDLTVH